jgi:drug/metabolite transporter (DMT)-like permease
MVPIWSAAIAYKVYHESLQFNHYVGMALLTICMGLISLSNVLDISTTTLIPPENATYIELLKYHPVTPVTLALIATLLIAINMNIVKYYDKRGFPADVFAYACYGITNFIQALIAFVVFHYHGFNLNFFFFGFCGSFLNTVGLVFTALAVSSGLSGPSSALVNL